ncbi:type II toxin-antitoxin system RelE family toxin [Candidatus Thiothrix anitrata]|jgi:mRNA-degrading endonuclease RelE of RelBE toxin-antitoxin system|uniref:Type II toxin-antitoxin system RelE/ParE family toxin n=1 Tax=Candidatus Thiothrix anitrata TaxID=2823902 RepID=A0ABX7X8G7_9GAMM|nr:type II toxin-antitoxin system RelE/ParE family toxin [Candidatus Thiothrix anitrata]QTR51519.1 type II toxin-antitoxin system RelE/ParE family toxin [Candidatus Thiothrix anitrata]
MNEIRWKPKAAKQLRKIQQQEAATVFDKVEVLKTFPECENADIKPLVNHTHGYRLRVGRYRVLFDYDGGIRVISIEEVKKRDGRTY